MKPRVSKPADIQSRGRASLSEWNVDTCNFEHLTIFSFFVDKFSSYDSANMGRKDNKVPTEKQEASHKLNFLHQVCQLVYKLCGP